MSDNKMRQAALSSQFALNSLIVYRELLDDSIIIELKKFIDYTAGEGQPGQAIGYLSGFYGKLLGISPTFSLKDYIIDKIRYSENPYSLALEAGDKNTAKHLETAVCHDLDMLKEVLDRFEELTGQIIETQLQNYEKLSSWAKKINSGNLSSNSDKLSESFNKSIRWSSCIADLENHYSSMGCGIFARFNALTWENCMGKSSLRGISQSDPVKLSDLIGYQEERSSVIENTLQLLNGYPANNVLLYGDRGTGKSSTVKAILNEYSNAGLRLIELPKKHLSDFAAVLNLLRNRKFRFIIFVDDLAFEDNEEEYTALKAILEGGVESKPENVVIYATSNRRHLVKEKFSDRSGLSSGSADDEVRSADTLQEKLSLSDRFGITAVFSSPDKEHYLKIVEGIIEKRGLKVDSEYLKKEALKWELWYNGRSPRTARQFVDWLEGKDKGN
ncbi:MAG: ATP-binding protein [Bacillota bacterium]|nr:ATP-binding protein [Bacillota bacterium]